MKNEPVAIRYDFDGYGYQYMDSGSGSDWQTRVEGEFLYTHPAKTLTDKEDTECQYCKQGCIRCDARKLLTDEEIKELSEKHLDMDWQTGVIEFARAILRKANEK